MVVLIYVLSMDLPIRHILYTWSTLWPCVYLFLLGILFSRVLHGVACINTSFHLQRDYILGMDWPDFVNLPLRRLSLSLSTLWALWIMLLGSPECNCWGTTFSPSPSPGGRSDRNSSVFRGTISFFPEQLAPFYSLTWNKKGSSFSTFQLILPIVSLWLSLF